ncbi:MAG: RNA 2',3'-cyclic phosphodiesterase [Desulfosarcina sp.]|nr:RNA 2',3'-cyclic phosphodiesterase [Desulfosarcina sp.]
MPKTLRAFVAVPIPDAVALFLMQIQAQLQLPKRNIRWVAAKNIHLTLKFLGDIDPSRVPAVAAQMDAAANATAAFSLTAKGVGVFPDLGHARVLWVGLVGDLDRLKTIQAALESGMASAGFKRETRGFGAHLTIGRIRRRIDAQLISESVEPLKAVASDGFRVDRLMLLKSILTPNGPEYTLLHTSHLAA